MKDIIYPHDLAQELGTTPVTINKQIRTGNKLPPLDVKLTNKTRYWFRSTLVDAGILPASQQSVEASSGVVA